MGSSFVLHWKLDLIKKKIEMGELLPYDAAAWLIEWSFNESTLRNILSGRGKLPYETVEFNRICAIGNTILVCCC